MSIELYVDPGGRDEWSGSLSEANSELTDGPLASLTKAHRLIADLREREGHSAENKMSASIIMRAGRYYVDEETIVAIEENSMTGSNFIEYCSYPGELVLCSAGRHIPGWAQQQEWYLTLYSPPTCEPES